jgi:phosphoesterase RecJ-like protein
MKENSTPQEIWEALQEAKSPVCILDSRFDFDSLNSAVFMHKIIKRLLNKKLDLFCEYSSIPDNVKRLNIDPSAIHFGTDPKSLDLTKYDLLITLDTGNLNHLCKLADYSLTSPIKLLNIDHHTVNTHFGDLNYVKKCASTTSQLFRLFSSLNIALEPEELYLLCVALIVDSGFFTYDSMTAEDFEMAAFAMKSGVDVYGIIHTLQFNLSLETYKMRKVVYSNMNYFPEEKVVWSYITQDEMNQNQINAELNNEPAADMIKYLSGIDYAFVVRAVPGEENIWNVSLRSHNRKFSSRLVASEFGGGGHDMAAGCNIKYEGDIKDVATIVISKVSEMKAAGRLVI